MRWPIQTGAAIGVAAADVDGDGREEIYILNTDTFAGRKRLADRLFVWRDGVWLDAFELAANIESLNLTAGRSVCALDRQGFGRYSIVVANYGGPLRLYEVADDLYVVDVAAAVGMALTTGGRGLLAGPLVTDDIDLFCTNENDANFLFANVDATFEEVAVGWGVADRFEHGRGAAVVDVDGHFALACGNWEGPHRFWVPAEGGGFNDHATAAFALPSPVRTVIAADFDNDGREEIFFNNIGEANRLFPRRRRRGPRDRHRRGGRSRRSRHRSRGDRHRRRWRPRASRRPWRECGGALVALLGARGTG